MAGPIRISILANARDAVRGLDETGRSATTLGTKLRGAAGAAAKYAAVGLGVAAGAAAVGLAKLTQGAIEDQRSAEGLAQTLRKTTGATRAQVAANEAYISRQGVLKGVTDDELRPALAKLATATGSVSKAQRLTSLAMNISAGTGKSLSTVTQGLARAQTGSIAGLAKFGISTKDAAGHTISLAAATGKLSRAYSGQATRAAGTVSGKFDRLKLILSETGESIGYKLLPYANKLATFLLRKIVPSVDKLSAAFSRNGFDGFTRQLEHLTGTEGKLTPILDRVRQVARDVGDVFTASVVPALAATVGQLPSLLTPLGLLTGLLGFLADHATTAKIAVGALVVGFTAYKTVMLAVNAVTLVVDAATAAYAAVQTVLNVVLSANPIALVVLAIAALAVGLVIAYKKSETFRNVVQKAFAGLKVAAKVIGEVVGFVKSHWQLIVGIIGGPIIAAVILVVRNWAKIKAATAAAFNAVKAVVSGVWNGIKAVISGAVNGAHAIVTGQWNAIKAVTSAAFNGAREIVSRAFNAIKSAVTTGVNGAVTIVRQLPGKITTALAGIGSLLINAGHDLIQGFINGIADMFGAVQGKLGELTGKLTSWKGPPARDKVILRKAGRQIIEGLIDGFNDRTPDVKATLGALTDRIGAYYSKLFGKNKRKAAEVTAARLKGLRDEYAALRANGAAQDANTARLEKARKALQDLRNTARDYAAGIKDAVVAFGSVVGLGVNEDGTVSTQGLLDQLKDKLIQAQRYAALIKRLTADHLNTTTLQQIIAAGVDGGLATAEAIAAGGAAAIAQINTLTGQITATGGALGNAAADTMYSAGIRTAQGLVDGLAKQGKALDKVAKRLAETLITAVKKALGIKSPSRVFAALGRQTALGLNIGLRAVDVRGAGASLADSLTKGFGTPALGAYLAGGAAGASPTVRVQLELSAQQIDALSRGRQIRADLDLYESHGGKGAA